MICIKSQCPSKEQKPEDFITSVKDFFGGLGIKLHVKCYKSSSHHELDENDNEIQNLYNRAKKIQKNKGEKNVSQIPGVYVFLLDDDCCCRCLKVGKVVNIGEARWRSQHYNIGSAESTLLDSIAKAPNHFKDLLDKEKNKNEGYKLLKTLKNYQEAKKESGKWLKEHTCRLEFIFEEESEPTYANNFLEGYLQWLLRPCYEGKIKDE